MTDSDKRKQFGEGERELLVQQLVSVEQFYVNVSQAVIVITEDKLELYLNRYLKKVEQKNAWIAPAGICTTVIAALVTTNFKDFVLPSDVWNAIFILAGIASLVWFVLALKSARNSINVEKVVEELKSSHHEVKH